jgi:competence ComEA-like helix-hairpin-helix protein
VRLLGWLSPVLVSAMLWSPVAAAGEPLDLNRAEPAQLQELPGIGPKKAEAIVALRQRRPFTRVTQLLEVRGIGPKTLERLRPLLKVEPMGVAEAREAKGARGEKAARAGAKASREAEPLGAGPAAEARAEAMGAGSGIPAAPP